MKERVKYIDFFRFLAIVNMVIYHAYYDVTIVKSYWKKLKNYWL